MSRFLCSLTLRPSLQPGRHANRSLSNRWRLFFSVVLLLSGLAPVCETEPNDAIKEANVLREHEYCSGRTSPAGDEDYLLRAGASINDLIFAYADGEDEDTVLNVFADDGITLIETNNSAGGLGQLNAAVAGAIVPQQGNVYFRVSENGNDEAIDYALFQAVLNPADTAAESENNNSSGAANYITAGIMTGNVVNGGGDVDFFRFTAKEGSRVVVIVDDNPDNDGAFTNTQLHILNTDGVNVLIGGTGGNFFLDVANGAGATGIPATGEYFIRIQHGGTVTDSDYSFVLLVDGIVYRDADNDHAADTGDNCPGQSNESQSDGDGDNVGDACEACPGSSLKQEPGICGCDEPDVDIGDDGTIDCGLADPAREMLAGRGLLLVPDADKSRIMAFDPKDGNLIDASFVPADPTHLGFPIAAILGPDQESILVSDNELGLIQRFDLDGNFLGTFAPVGGADPAIIDAPWGLALHPLGFVLVCVQHGANENAVVAFSIEGTYFGTIIAAGAGGLQDPTDIQIRPNGNMLITDNTSNIKEFDSFGGFIGNFNQAPIKAAPRQLFESDFVLAAASESEAGFDDRGVMVLRTDGTLENRFSPSGLSLIHGIYALGNGNILVSSFVQAGLGSSSDVFGGETPGWQNGGVFELGDDGELVQTEFSGAAAMFIEFAQQDKDGDGTGDGLDGCPTDPAKTDPGQCGCHFVDTDSDGDGIADCVDSCPDDPSSSQCGCGLPDTDTDGDGVADCIDNCVDISNTDQADADANGIGDLCEDAAAPAPGCGACGAGAGIFMPLMIACLITARCRSRLLR